MAIKPDNPISKVDRYVNTSFDIVRRINDNLVGVLAAGEVGLRHQAKNIAPVVRYNGDPLETGDTWYDTVTDIQYTWSSGEVWVTTASSINAQVEVNRVAIVALDGTTTTHTAQIGAIETDITNVNGTLTTQQSSIDALEVTVNHPTAGVTANASAASSLNTRVTTTEADILTNASDITALETTVNHPSTGVAANSTAVTSLDSRVTTTETNISTNASDITALESTVNDGATGVVANANAVNSLDTRVTDTENSITSQASQITTLEAAVAFPAFDVNANYSIGTYFVHATITYKVIAAQTPPNATPPNATFYSVIAADSVADLVGSASVEVEANAIAITDKVNDITGLQAKYGVTLNVKDYITGFAQHNNGTVGTFQILADKFAVVDPANDGQNPVTPFSVSNGVTYIAAAMIEDGSITNAKIGGNIQSDNWTGVSPFPGWQITPAGAASFQNITIRDGSGNIVLTSGGSYAAAIANSSVTLSSAGVLSGAGGGTIDALNLLNGPTAAGADVTFDNLAGSGVNVANYRYSVGEVVQPPPTAINGTASYDNLQSYFGAISLKLVPSTADMGCYLGATSTDYNVKITPNKKWIFSVYVRSSVATTNALELFVRTNNSGQHYAAAFTPTAANTWERISTIMDLSADSSTECILRVDANINGSNVWYDGIMFEEQIGSGTTPSAYALPAGTPESVLDLDYIGDLNANNTTNTNQLTDGANLGGTATWAGVTGTGKAADNATVGATIGTNLSGSFNQTTFNTAIGSAVIQNAHIGNLSVATLNIQDNAVTLPVSSYVDASFNPATFVWSSIATISPTGTNGTATIIGSFYIKNAGTLNTIQFRLRNVTDNAVIYTSAAITTPFESHLAFSVSTNINGTKQIDIETLSGATSSSVSKRSLIYIETKK